MISAINTSLRDFKKITFRFFVLQNWPQTELVSSHSKKLGKGELGVVGATEGSGGGKWRGRGGGGQCWSSCGPETGDPLARIIKDEEINDRKYSLKILSPSDPGRKESSGGVGKEILTRSSLKMRSNSITEPFLHYVLPSVPSFFTPVSFVTTKAWCRIYRHF